MKLWFLFFLLPLNAFAYLSMLKQDWPILGFRVVEVSTTYDLRRFSGYTTRVMEYVKLDAAITQKLDHYSHTVWTLDEAYRQHEFALSFIRNKHIKEMLEHWERIKNLKTTKEELGLLFDIDEEKEEPGLD